MSTEEVPTELILNWDQTGIRVQMIGVNGKRQMTAIFCGALTCDFLPVQLVYNGKTPCCHPHFEFPLGWHITHFLNHWSTEQTMLQYIEYIILPSFSKRMKDCSWMKINWWRQLLTISRGRSQKPSPASSR